MRREDIDPAKCDTCVWAGHYRCSYTRCDECPNTEACEPGEDGKPGEHRECCCMMPPYAHELTDGCMCYEAYLPTSDEPDPESYHHIRKEDI